MKSILNHSWKKFEIFLYKYLNLSFKNDIEKIVPFFFPGVLLTELSAN